MKNYRSTIEFITGLVGVIIHSIIALFMLSYLAYPEFLEVMIDASSGIEKEMLLTFVSDASQIHVLIYLSTAIIIFEWISIFQILRYENKLTPLWSAYLILGSLYAYVYFGGLEVSVLLMISGTMTLYKYNKHHKHSKNSLE